MNKIAKRRITTNERILPQSYKFKNKDPIWDDVILPLGFKQNIERSILVPLRRYNSPNDYAFIIFGPPGTGKTTVVKSIAKQLDWEFYYIGPQHFVKKGFSIEDTMKLFVKNIRDKANQKTKNQEKSKKLAKIIIAFDEIDELVVSRDVGTDRQTRLATTMMLPLIQDLRDAAEEFGFVFFVLTNHIERFDPAITRKGRFDLILPLGPPDRAARFLLFEKFLEDIREDYLKKHNLEIKTEFILKIEKEKKPEVTADLDVISRISSRLTLKDIESICRNVADHQVARYPSLRDTKNGSVLYLETNFFIDWIYKFRNTSTRNDIDKFYQDRDKYYRGSTLYTKSNTLQEKVEHEFSSLVIKHNLSKLGQQWKKDSKKQIQFSFRNLAGLSPFNGRISVGVILNKKDVLGIKHGRKNETLTPGQLSHQYTLSVTPKKKGDLYVIFFIEGQFDLLGIERVLEFNKATLSGTVNDVRKIKIV